VDRRLTRFTKRMTGRGGMTLIEVMVAVVLLSLILIAVITLTNVSITGIYGSGEKNRAIAAAMEKSDQVYYTIINAADSDRAEEYVKNIIGYVESGLYLSSLVSEPQFYCEKGTYEVDGHYSEGFDVIVVVYYNGGRNHVEIRSFVLKPSGDE
jgi:prepilin-type N-terminal cleavage/methylation domain-containing protein